ncbi:MAG: hypothetical protein KAG10_01110 [Methylococcales bacterium]|nr:hypothetical protein [Methylococcales bacterium]
MTTGTMTPNNPLLKADFKALVPHSGDMLLIDSVKKWSTTSITTGSYSHQKTNHPLRLKGVLSSLHLIEYGAQTIALHCGLLSGKSQEGFLAAVKEAHFYVDEVQDLADELQIDATIEHQATQGAVYQLKITANGKLLLSAQITVIHV